MHKSDYLGGRNYVGKIIFNFRYFTILYFSLVYFLVGFYESNLVIYSDLYSFALVNLVYLIYVIVLQLFRLREKFSSLTHRVVRINIDLIYFGIVLFLIGHTQYQTYFIYLIPLISAINYKQNRYYFRCSSFISIYFIFLQFSLFLDKQISINLLIGNTAIFSLFVFVFATILDLYDRRYMKNEAELIKIKDFIQNVRHSRDYHEALNILIEELKKLTGVPIITIMIHDDRKNELFIAESCGIRGDQKLLRLKPGTGICGNVFKNRKYIVVNDTTNRKKNSGYKEFKGLQKPVLSELCFPLVLQNGEILIGVLNFETYERNYFDDELVSMINNLIHNVEFILDKTLNDYKFNQEIRKKTETYSETILYLRELAHGWRNNLNTFVQLPDYILGGKENDQEMLKHLASIQDSECKLLKHSLNKALEARTIYTPNLNNVKITSIIRNITNDNYYFIRKNNVVFVPEINYTEKFLETDLEWLCSILNNLITNSINAYIKNEIEKRNIRLEVDSHNSNIRFILSDQAGGLDPTIAEKISDSSIYDIQHGRLGLNLVRKYTSLLKGNIKCEITKDPPGTVFTITFPISQKDGD